MLPNEEAGGNSVLISRAVFRDPGFCEAIRHLRGNIYKMRAAVGKRAPPLARADTREARVNSNTSGCSVLLSQFAG